MTPANPATPEKVQITSALRSRLSVDGLAEAVFVQDFCHWRNGADIYEFGRDAAGLQRHPRLRHVHLVPLLDPSSALTRWNRDWEKWQKDRTSDRYLLYVDGGFAHGYLLILILNDSTDSRKGAHALWDNPKAVATLSKISDDFWQSGIVPP